MKVVEKSLLFVLLSCMVCHTETDTPTSTFELFSNATKVAMLVREAYIGGRRIYFSKNKLPSLRIEPGISGVLH